MLALDRLDRFVIGYLILPLVIFLIGWFKWWAAVPLLACTAYALRPLWASQVDCSAALTPTPLQMIVAAATGCGWTLCGGAGHILFANPDWYVRDAVLHDLVMSPWPVGYGVFDGRVTLLRAPLAFYLPASTVGKLAGLIAAHAAMGLWTALGTSLFLLQVQSLVPARGRSIGMVVAVVMMFSGFDIVGSLISTPHFASHWNIAKHLEWWAGSYQYSSMTTQLFWVPNHALGAWLLIGLMSRNGGLSVLDPLLPILLVAAALWSPLSAIGLVPFVICRAWRTVLHEHRIELLHPGVWLPAGLVGIPVAAYLLLDPDRIAKGVSVGSGGMLDVVEELLRHAQFFLLEAGFIGFAVLAIHRTTEVVIALVVLAVLPLIYLGPSNDLVMRASIPSLAVLSIGACLALSRSSGETSMLRKKMLLGLFLVIGAVTPVQEFARAAMLPRWPINTHETLTDVNCGAFPAHYIARLRTQWIRIFMKAPYRLSTGSSGTSSCENPAIGLMWHAGLLSDQGN